MTTFIIHLKHVGANPKAVPTAALTGPAPAPDLKVGERFHIDNTPDDVWWEVTDIEMRHD